MFDIFISYTIEAKNEKKYDEDYLIIFHLLSDNLKDNFSDMIFLLDKFTQIYQNFTKKFISDEEVIIKIFHVFTEVDKDFPSLSEELSSYLRIVELFLNMKNLSDKIKVT